MTNPTLAEKLNSHLDAGQVVTISTAHKSTAITAKGRAAWRAHDQEVFKTDARGDTVMIDGAKGTVARYACIGTKHEPFVRITISEGPKK